jgi:hypothetical protein
MTSYASRSSCTMTLGAGRRFTSYTRPEILADRVSVIRREYRPAGATCCDRFVPRYPSRDTSIITFPEGRLLKAKPPASSVVADRYALSPLPSARTWTPFNGLPVSASTTTPSTVAPGSCCEAACDTVTAKRKSRDPITSYLRSNASLSGFSVA